MTALTVEEMLLAAKNARESSIVRIEVPEFSPDGAPPVVVYGKLPTIKDRSEILAKATDEATGRLDSFEAAVRTVIRLALDAQGAPLFTLDHAQFLRVNVPADVIEALAYRLNAGMSYEAAKKKSMTNPSSDTG